MAINFANFLGQAQKPDLSGIGDVVENIGKGYQIGRMPDTMREQQESRMRDNAIKAIQQAFAPQEAQARLGLMGAQTAHANAQAAQMKMLQDYLSGGGSGGSGQQDASLGSASTNVSDSSQSPGMMVDEMQAPASAESTQMQSSQGGQIDPRGFAKAAMLSKALGLMQPKVVDVDGRQVAITPFGNYDVAQGMNPLQKELTKQDAKSIGEIEQGVRSAYMQKDTQDELSLLMNQPEFQAMRQYAWTPGFELKYYAMGGGTPEQQEMIGNFRALSGNLIKASARDFAGQFRSGEQELLQNMKPNENDSLGVAIGKLNALKQMREMLTQRGEMAIDLARTGKYSPIQAIKKADESINANDIRKQIKSQLSIQPKQVHMITPSGKSVWVPTDKVEEFVKQGGTHG